MSKHPLLKITDAAKTEITTLLEKQSKEILGIRARIDGVKSHEFIIRLGFAREQNADDVIVDCDAFKIFVDAVSAENLGGAAIDYVTTPERGFKVYNPNSPNLGIPKPREGLFKDPKARSIKTVIDNDINPTIAQHGGVIELLDLKGDTIYIHMGGGCQGCGMAAMTLKQGIESTLKEKFPEIKKIIDTTDHAGGKNPYYKPSK